MDHSPQAVDGVRDNVLKRLRRIEGQVRGIEKMVENGKDCAGVMAQMRAVKSALRSTNAVLLKLCLMECYAEVEQAVTSPDALNKMEDTIAVVAKFMDD
jgi:DNA-binding FrmR family transcriptional regulator